METKKKRVYKLKTWPKVLFVLIIIGCIAFYYGNKYYQEYLYEQTNEYKLLQEGYSADDVSAMLAKLSDEQEKDILNRDYNEFIPRFIECKYFMYKNLDDYLNQVITKDEDFFKYHGTTGYDYDSIVSLVNVHGDEAYYSGTLTTDLTKGAGMIANKHFKLGEYIPSDLVDVGWKYRLGGESDNIKISSEAYDAFLKMWDAANEEGIYLLIISGYRSYTEQQEVYDEYKNSKGEAYADAIASHAQYSEHQTGLAIDMYSKECTSSSTFKDSKTYAWLIANSYKYGFILRYPDKKESITGYKYESWHFRYLGVDLATKVYNEGITYDEYYAYYLDN
ncbi:MAG TPA: M15 family metallopeptidase [Bacilli bacterium]|mgnify:CR=1 FL=1|jgi:D-alanyl-D-alanine carboxypeptidase|nr:M15 family metallopeptidase [Bacilli bacterium]HPZ23492.1 M15 family metallopeptidase [Bacilli bacterium]HQC83562.1 M15 family metallopeptidase [Bacilli bacterium]